MRDSVQVTLTVVAGVALAACGPATAKRANPCDAATFSDQACQDAIAKGGYFWNGSWYPMNYSHPYPYYYGSYQAYIANGGTVVAAPASAYSPAAGAVERGGFGEAGAAHGAGEGVGE
jgi:hypothetical protein